MLNVKIKCYAELKFKQTFNARLPCESVSMIVPIKHGRTEKDGKCMKTKGLVYACSMKLPHIEIPATRPTQRKSHIPGGFVSAMDRFCRVQEA